MAMAVLPPSSSASFHGTPEGPIRSDKSSLFYKSRPPDLVNQDKLASDAPVNAFSIKDVFQRWSDRNNNSQAESPRVSSRMVKEPPLIADAKDPYVHNAVSAKEDDDMTMDAHGALELPPTQGQFITHEKYTSTNRAVYILSSKLEETLHVETKDMDTSKLEERLDVEFFVSLSAEETLKTLKHANDIPTVDAFILILRNCRKTKHRGLVKYMLAYVFSVGLDCVDDLANSLVATLLDCISMALAQQVFCKLNVRTEFSWTYIIREHTECGRSEHAVSLFRQMEEDCVAASKFTFVALLKACARLKCVERGQKFYLEIVKVGLESDYYIGNMLLDLYAKCGSRPEAQHVFERLSVQDVVSWTSLILGYLDKGLSRDALNCFEQMLEKGISPDAFTFVCGLKACGSLRAKEKGQKIHAYLVEEEFEGDSFVGNVLVDMYVKCGLLVEAWDVFDNLLVQDVVSWTALIAGAAEQGENDAALLLYYRMHEQGLPPNDMTFASILKACTNRSDEETGKRLHVQIQAVSRLETLDLITATALIDMYAKCGSMADAQEIFDAMPKRDLVGWNALMTGYTRQGESKLVFQLFDRMVGEGVQPDQITYLSALTACSHAGLVDKGKFYFDALGERRGMAATIKHYNCMVDLLGRAGQLKEALTMLQNMPFPPDLVAWATLLAACRKWGNVEIGRQAFEATLRLDEKHTAAFNSMFNIYVDANMWEEAKKIEAMRMMIGAGKEHTKSWIEIDGSLHTFVVGDAPHSNLKYMYGKLEAVYTRLEEEWLVQSFKRVMKGIVDNTLEHGPCGHSEVLAVLYGLINTPDKMSLHVVKNCRVCDDCHVVLSAISKVENRAISCRDTCSVHAFRGGNCSCEDIGNADTAIEKTLNSARKGLDTISSTLMHTIMKEIGSEIV